MKLDRLTMLALALPLVAAMGCGTSAGAETTTTSPPAMKASAGTARVTLAVTGMT